MSTAAAFKFRQPFPFCVTDISSSVPSQANHVDNLTLSEAMAFAWNLETFTLTTSGTCTNGVRTNDGAMSLCVAPFSSSTRFNRSSLQDNCMWYGDSFAETLFASWPDIRQPIERVCLSAQSVAGCLIDTAPLGPSGGGFNNVSGNLAFWIGTDPVNSGKYRIYYIIFMESNDSIDGSTSIAWFDKSALTGFTSFNSGSVTICGQVFSYWAFRANSSISAIGGTMSASSGSFTY